MTAEQSSLKWKPQIKNRAAKQRPSACSRNTLVSVKMLMCSTSPQLEFWRRASFFHNTQHATRNQDRDRVLIQSSTTTAHCRQRKNLAVSPTLPSLRRPSLSYHNHEDRIRSPPILRRKASKRIFLLTASLSFSP